MEFIIYILLIVVVIKDIQCNDDFKLSSSICEPNRAELCSGLYNETTFPNQKHRSQDDAIMDLNQYKQLIQTRCAKHLRLFLCSVFVPFCTVLDKPLQPCRSLCLEAQAGCEKVLEKYVDLPWPKQLRCSQFPEASSNSLCIGYTTEQPKGATELKQVNVPENKKTKIIDGTKAVLQCTKPQKIEFKKIIHENPKCNRETSKGILKKLCDGESQCDFSLDNVVKGGKQSAGCKEGHVGSSSVKYQCTSDSKLRQITLKYNEDAKLKCKNRFRHIVISNVQFKNEACVTPNAFCSVSQTCTGLHSCSLWAEDSYIQSSCNSENTRLIVDYECVKQPQDEKKVETDLMSDITLTCPPGELLKIIRAEYTDECYEKEINCAVTLICEKKNTCLITANKLSTVMCEGGRRRSRIRIRYTCT